MVNGWLKSGETRQKPSPDFVAAGDRGSAGAVALILKKPRFSLAFQQGPD
jgi:hypothetical protein